MLPKARLLISAPLGALVALAAHTWSCAPRRGADEPRQIGPRLGESTAALPGNSSVPPPDARPRSISVPFSRPPSPGTGTTVPTEATPIPVEEGTLDPDDVNGPDQTGTKPRPPGEGPPPPAPPDAF